MFVSIKKIGQGSSIDYVVSQFPAVKRNFLFLVIQEYYRNYENNNKILLNYVHDKTPKNILILLKICLTLLYFSNKPQYAIVNDAVQEGKNLKKEKLINAVLRNILRNKNKIKYGKFI